MHQTTTNYEKLNQLIDMNYLEFLISKDSCRLVYMLNDAVESFLRLDDYILTGNCRSDIYDAEYAELTRDQRGPLLLVRQDENHVFSIRFSDISLEVHLFNYAKIGHFWMKKYERIRQIEYHIAILRDKYRYLGEDYCTPEEIILSRLDSFPPLQLYPSAPKKYWSREDLWRVDPEAISVAASLAEEAGDIDLRKKILHYGEHPTKSGAKKIASMMHQSSHRDFINILWKKIDSAAAVYPDRSFGREKDIVWEEAFKKAQEELAAYERKGIQGVVLKEEPFLYVDEPSKCQIHLLLNRNHMGHQVSEIITHEIYFH